MSEPLNEAELQILERYLKIGEEIETDVLFASHRQLQATLARVEGELATCRSTRDDIATNLNAYVFKLAQVEQREARLQAALIQVLDCSPASQEAWWIAKGALDAQQALSPNPVK